RVATSPSHIDPTLRTPYLQHYLLNVQYELARDFLLEVGYAASKGTKLFIFRFDNQALLASPQSPIRGITENTRATVPVPVPVLGLTATPLEVENGATYTYHSLQSSVTERFSRGLQFLASCASSKSVDPSAGGTAILLGGLSGDQAGPRKQPRGA